MSDEIKSIAPSVLGMPSNTPVQAVQQTGEKNVFASHVDSMNVTIQTNMAPQLLQPNKVVSVNADTTHYNLFVTVGADIERSMPFMLDLERVLTEYMNDDLKAEFSTLSDAAIAKIKTFPSIFANENTDYGHTDENQVLGLGFVKQIKVRHEGVRIYPDIRYLLPQQRLNEALFELDIRGNDSFNELNRIHWCIKKVDLIAELRELGFNI